MRKLFTLVLLAMFAVTASAQDKKTWDFSKGWSDETLANLEAGSEWKLDGSSWKETGKFGSGGFVANGEPIKELEGLTRSSAGLSKNNNYLLTATTFRLNRNNMELIFPNLKNGQKLTIVGRSANATAKDRGVVGKYDYMVRIDDDKENNLILGSNVEGSKGTYTFVYEIQTSEADAVPVAIKMITGGIDFSLFMIDEGDPIQTTTVAYLCAGDASGDAAKGLLDARENTEVTVFDVSSQTVTAADLQGYTLTVVAPSVPADNAAVASVKEAMPWTPILNMNPDLYAAWGYGTSTSSGQPFAFPKDKSDLTKGLESMQEGEGEDAIIFYPLSNTDLAGIQLGDYFNGDVVPFTDMSSSYAVAHHHNGKHNAYIYVPAPDGLENGSTLFSNAVEILVDSKQEITPAPAPVISQEYKDMNTNVTIKPGRDYNKTQIYYTIDGSEPTIENGTPYEGVFNLTQACTVKAVAIAEGYTVSEASSLDINIYSQPKSPAIAYNESEGQTTVTLAATDADVDIWYNFTDAGVDTLQSTKYTEPFVITMPQNITTFAVAGGMVFSEPTTQRVLVKNPRVVIDVAAHFAANQWTADNNAAGLSVNNGKGVFSWGQSPASMWTDEGIETVVVDPETGDEKTVITHDPTALRDAERVVEPGDDPQWILHSRGTCLIWQNLTPGTSQFGSDAGYNPLYSTDVDPLFPSTKNAIQFYKFQANEEGNGAIESINKYQAPLDVVVLANMAGGPLLVQVSADSLQWETIGTIEKSGYSRMWSKYTSSYNESNEVYVRVTQTEASGGAKVFDIFIANAGENSKELKAQLDEEYQTATGINTYRQTSGTKKAIYNLNGMSLQKLQRGLNIVVMGDGTVRKVVVK